jgi:hypothetical protein
LEINMQFLSTKNNSKDLLIDISDFKGGSNNLVDEARMDTKFAVESNNMMQVQNGLWKTRWGTQAYGAALAANPDGAQEYVKSDGTTELIVIANGVAYKSTDGGSWSSISGATFTAGLQCYFMQLGGYDSSNVFHNYLYISNGTDALARYDGSTLSTYSSLSAPTGLSASLVASGLSSGTHVYYGQVTALNTVGETVGSTEASITTNRAREDWIASGTTPDKMVWSWNAVSGATRYQLYVSNTQGYESLLTSTDITNFTDDGTIDINPYVQVPYDNTTTAPKFTSMATSNNRIFATNNSSDMYKVYFSGTGRNIGAFSDFYGGGWINLERGGKELPIAVKHYQSGTGEGRATVLCKTSNGQGAVWQIQIISATVGDTTFSIPSASKVVGSFGTESQLGVVQGTNNISFPNRKGWFTLGSQVNYYGVLRTNELSSNIRPYWRSLAGSKISTICAYFYDAKIFISVPTSSSGNDRIVVFDEERSNWSVDWSIGAKQFFEYTDTSGNTHLLYIPTSGTKLIELSESYLNDQGVAFNQSYISPLIPVGKDKTNIMSLLEAVVELGRPQGVVNFQILGIGKNNTFSTIGTKTITNFGSNTGIGSDLFNDFFYTSTNDNSRGGAGSWAVYFTDTPSTFTQSTTKKAIKKKAKIYAIQFKVYSTSADTQYTINSLQAKGRLIQSRIPRSWTS